MRKFFEKVAALRREGRPFAIATVVGRRAPVSAHLGDNAIIFANGRMEGFVGGACAREIVRKHALEAMHARHPCLVSIRPDASEASLSNPEHIIAPMTCVSEGAVDVYIEPFVPPRRLVVVGMTPVAEALARTARSLDYEVVRVVDAREQRDLEAAAQAGGFTVATLESLETVLKSEGDVAAVVASQGHYDEEALAVILNCGVQYVGVVASRKRGATLRAFMQESGVPSVDRVRIPAGLDLGARTAPEVALSILAEIVQTHPSQAIGQRTEPQTTSPEPRSADHPASRDAGPARFGEAGGQSAFARRVPERSGGQADNGPRTTDDGPRTAIDPVCNMDVDIENARYTAEVGGTMYYFCCAQCRTRFTKDPGKYLQAS